MDTPPQPQTRGGDATGRTADEGVSDVVPASAAAPSSPAATPVSPLPSSTPEPPSEALLAYLAASDVRCPTCGYNLRGLASGACPECGAALGLALVAEVDRGVNRGAFRLLLLMSFGWPALAGLMNTIRFYQSAWSIATYTGIRNWPSYGTRTPAGAGGSTWFGRLRALNWSAVDSLTWMQLGWAASLAMTGIAGLASLSWYWNRPCPPRVQSRLIRFGVSVFLVYVLWHFGWFIYQQMWG